MRRETSGANFVYATPRFAILVHFFHTFGADAPPLILKKSTTKYVYWITSTRMGSR